ncbi:MAG: SPFH/Band 7/PHB domain protein [Lachnospiraceae bacterium]|nr:SPFH/Band 7/PHB domain protein [Lachnospiraceae bacterium]
MEYIIPIIIVLAILIFIGCLKVVPQSQNYVTEFLGKYSGTWDSGLRFKIPFFQKIVKKVSLKEQVADFPPQPVITKDNVTMQIDTVVYYKIIDPKLFTYGAENPIIALGNLTATTLRNLVGALELDETLTSRDMVNAKMQAILDEATDPWGIKVGRVELKNIIPPADIQNAMEKQMKAEREKRQTLLEAEAHRAASITRAEGDKQAMVLKAEAERDAAIARATGKAESIRLVYEAEARGIEMLKAAKMDESVMMLKKLDALKALGDGRATKIVVPTELASAASDITFKSEMLGLGESIDKSAKTVTTVAVDDDCCDDDHNSDVTKALAAANVEEIAE